MDWKGVGLSASLFAGGLAAIRLGLPLGSLAAATGLTTIGIVLTALGLAGLARHIKPHEPRHYEPDEPAA